MTGKNKTLNSFLKDLMRRRRRLPSQLAADVGISHATVSRWLSGKDSPSIASCHKLAEYSSTALRQVLSICGYVPPMPEAEYSTLPDFREYAKQKYPGELDEDLITMIEDLIERKRDRRVELKKKRRS